MPQIILAAMRRKMIAVAGEIGDGVVFANASRSFMSQSLSVLPEDKRNSSAFFIGNMIPTCIGDDEEACKAEVIHLGVHPDALTYEVSILSRGLREKYATKKGR